MDAAVPVAANPTAPAGIHRKAKRARVAAARRRKFLQRMILQNDQCFFCDFPLVDPATLTKAELEREPLRAEWEHRTPKSRGGTRGHNEVLACHVCNQKKRNRSEAEFRSEDARWLMLRRLDAPAVKRLRTATIEPLEVDATLLLPPLPEDFAAMLEELAALPLDIADMAAALAPMPTEERRPPIDPPRDWWREQPKWWRRLALVPRYFRRWARPF